MRIGAHVSAAGGADKTIGRAVEIGAEAVQFFPSSTRSWRFNPVDEKTAAEFKALAAEHAVGPNVFHAVYMVSLPSPDPKLSANSIQSLVNYMNTAGDLGVMGVIFHLNSHKGSGFEAVFRRIVENANRVLDNSPADVQLIIENSAGMGDHIGSKFSEIGRIIKAVDDRRVRACLDTQHAFAAGYDLRTPGGVSAMLDEFDREIGLDLLAAVHCNDSKRELGFGVDRHENIGEGFMGIEAFESVLANPAFKDVPFYLEVPGYEGEGPDKPNVDKLKAIRAQLGAAG